MARFKINANIVMCNVHYRLDNKTFSVLPYLFD